MSKVIIISLVILSLRHLGHTFITPEEISDVEERFVKGRTEYIMLNVRVTWIEAQIVCDSYTNGSLTIADTGVIRNFLGEALSETNLEMEDLWIGARKMNNVEGFVWVNGAGVYVPDKDFIRRGKETFTNISRDCLAFARQNHQVPHIINLECDLKRPFICEKPFQNIHNGSITTLDWIVVGNFKYGIFYDKKTWKQSVGECRRKHHAHLASFRNIRETTMVGKFELIGRPSVENAWIGAHFRNGYWRFLYSGKLLSEKKNEETLFPPWRPNREVKRAGCLLLDRHLTDDPIFLEARCDRKRSYICTKEIKHMPDFHVFIINGTGYILFYTKRSWDDAQEQCLSLEANLVKVTKKNIHDVTYIMGENHTEINHIWIGGKLNENGTYFTWVHTNEVINPNNKDINNYPPWFDNLYDQDHACLNMDRENHNRPIFYGIACETPQAFVCEQHDLTKLPAPAGD